MNFIFGKKPPDNYQHRHHVGQGIFEDATQKRGRMYFALISNCFDHEIGPVANVGIGAKEDGCDTDFEAGIAEQKRDFDLLHADALERLMVAKIPTNRIATSWIG
jgi:hypothetical protein